MDGLGWVLLFREIWLITGTSETGSSRQERADKIREALTNILLLGQGRKCKRMAFSLSNHLLFTPKPSKTLALHPPHPSKPILGFRLSTSSPILRRSFKPFLALQDSTPYVRFSCPTFASLVKTIQMFYFDFCVDYYTKDMEFLSNFPLSFFLSFFIFKKKYFCLHIFDFISKFIWNLTWLTLCFSHFL